jgi:hypothetical protein
MTATIHITMDQDTTYTANTNVTNWVLDEGVSIHVTSNNAIALTAGGSQSDRHFELHGSLISDVGTAFYLGGASEFQTPNSVYISEHGHLQASVYGAMIYGVGNSIINNGQIESQHTAILFGEEDNYFENNGEVYGKGYGIVGYDSDSHTVNTGEIQADENSGIWSTGSNVLIENIGDGKISSNGAAAEAIYLSGSGSVLRNEGAIEAFYGVRLHDDDIEVINSGTIAGGDTGIWIDLNAKNTEIANSGTISGGSFSIVGAGGDVSIVNTGTLAGAVLLAAGADRFENKGTTEDIFLAEGDDVFILRGGSSGVVDGGGGNDIYRLSKSANLTEGAVGGTDTVFAGLGWTLGANFENITLTGRRNIYAAGNELDNLLKGNRGENRLSGLSGDDCLTGGKGADTFVYATGDGADIIKDFQNGSDRLDLGGWSKITSFADLMAHHLTVTGDDLIVHAGSGTLTLLQTEKAELDATDFIF